MATSKRTRVCSRCNKRRPATSKYFIVLRKTMRDGSVWTGFARECRPCRNLRYKPYYKKHRKKLIKRATISTRKRRATEEGREAERRWSREAKRRLLADPKERRSHNRCGRKWRRDNPDRVKEFKHEQAGEKRFRQSFITAGKATPQWADREKICTIYLIADFLSRKTGIKYEVDHYYPLVHKDLCGLHVPWNLRVITRAANKAKGGRLP